MDAKHSQPKTLKCSYEGGCLKKKVIRCFIVEQRRWQSVNQIGSCKDTITSKLNGNVRLKMKSSSYGQQVLMFPLHNRILFWSINTTMLMHNAIRTIEIRHVKFHSIINSNRLNFVAKLSKNHRIKGRDKRSNF